MKLGSAIAALGLLAPVAPVAPVALVACYNKQPPSPCQSSIDNVLQRSVSVPDDDVQVSRDLNHRLAEQLAKLCTEDRWSVPMLECLDSVQDIQGARACSAKLSVSQAERLVKMMTALTGLPQATLQAALTGQSTAQPAPPAPQVPPRAPAENPNQGK
jgi:hypothetical protein